MSAPNPILERGVYVAPYHTGGQILLFAVTSSGERSGELPLSAQMPEAKARRILLKHLDHVDPLPRSRLRLLKPR